MIRIIMYYGKSDRIEDVEVNDLISPGYDGHSQRSDVVVAPLLPVWAVDRQNRQEALSLTRRVGE